MHTSLGKYPAKYGKARARMAVEGAKPVLLELDEPYESAVPKFGLARFVVHHEDPKGHLSIEVINEEGSDADIYVGIGDQLPSMIEHVWASTGTGNDTIIIKPDDFAFSEGSHATIASTFNIAVYGGGGKGDDVVFTITVSSSRPVKGEMYESLGNMEALTADRRFGLERRQAEARRLKTKTGQQSLFGYFSAS